MLNSLKPCPFCSGKAEWAEYENCGIVKCSTPSCGAEINIEGWNTRAPVEEQPSPRDCPDCGQSARGGPHHCPDTHQPDYSALGNWEKDHNDILDYIDAAKEKLAKEAASGGGVLHCAEDALLTLHLKVGMLQFQDFNRLVTQKALAFDRLTSAPKRESIKEPSEKAVRHVIGSVTRRVDDLLDMLKMNGWAIYEIEGDK